MAVTYMDTEKLKDINENINYLIQDYYREINSMFTKFSNVPEVTREWVGDSSKKYFQEVGLEKNDFVYFGQTLASFKDALTKTIEKTDLTLSKVNNIEKGA